MNRPSQCTYISHCEGILRDRTATHTQSTILAVLSWEDRVKNETEEWALRNMDMHKRTELPYEKGEGPSWMVPARQCWDLLVGLVTLL